MGDIIFAKTRYNYDSYTDFWTLVHLSEYRWDYVDTIDWHSDNLYITAPMNGELQSIEIPKDRTCKIKLWNLERPGGSGGLSNYVESNNALIKRRIIDGVIVSDKQLARDTGFQYVPIGGHVQMGELSNEKVYDVIHLMCYSSRRGMWFQYPDVRQYVDGITVAPNCWGKDRHKALMYSRFMLNIHQDDFQYMEPLRFVLAACYGLPIVSETVIDWWPYVDTHQSFVLGDEIKTVKHMLKNPDYWKVVGDEMREFITTAWTFRNGIEAFI